ncbi:hypothetical protein JNW90_13790 [Micromonospora sp. STR1s_5]|nr:hypothetical protein [Micromonospora sp. STR1s_5]
MSSWRARTAARDQKRPEGWIKPCLLTLAETVPTKGEWLFEVKHDGFRMCARFDGGRARVWSRNGLNWTKAFPSIIESLNQIGRDIVLDGEAVCQNPDGSSDFHALAGEDGCKRAVLWAFDLLMLDGVDLRAEPVEARREKLETLLRAASVTGIAFSEHSTGDGQKMFEAACRMNLEGIVAKRLGTRYTSGRSRHWLKIKNPTFARA